MNEVNLNNETKKNSVLIVDDENSNIMALTDILSPDYSILAAKNGTLAIKAAEKHMPDVILLDIVMPDIDGYSVIAALKKSEKTQNIPVVFVTGLCNPYDEEKGLELGAADYIVKPFSPSIVKLRVRNQVKMLEQLRVIERLSLTDQLTSLPNRRAFDVRLNLDWGRALREKTPVSILVIDIDRFKKYNDTYGHQQGDAALKAMAEMFPQILKRPGDFATRWGGEEFVVLLPNTNEKGAIDVAEQIRIHVEGMKISCSDGKKTKITVSVGVNTIIPVRKSIIEQFVSEADRALYSAKKNGRNRVLHVNSL